MADPAPTTLSLTDIVGLVIDTVKQVEAVFPAGSGKDKFDAVYAQIIAFAPLASVGAAILQNLLPVFINTTVSVFNRIGAFLHPASPTAATPTA